MRNLIGLAAKKNATENHTLCNIILNTQLNLAIIIIIIFDNQIISTI